MRGAHHGEPQWFAVAALLCAPCLLAAAVACRAVQVTEQALISSSLVRKQEIPWSAIRRLDRRRRSFVVETAAGPVSAGWLAPAERERLMRLIIQRGRLSLSAEEPPWGIEARYLPRAEDIAFVPHHARKKHDSDH